MKVFVPVSDEDLAADNGVERLVPYRPGMSLWSQVTVEPSKDGVNRYEVPVRPREARPARLLSRH